MRKRFRVVLIFETNDDPEIPDNEFFQEQWEQTAAAQMGDSIVIEKIEECPGVETKKL